MRAGSRPGFAADRGLALDLQILERIGNAHYALGDMTRSAIAYESIAIRAADAGVLDAQADALTAAAHP